MAFSPTSELAFDEDDLGPVVAIMAELTAAASGWVNFVPEVEEGEEPPPRNPVVAIFSARGDAIPMSTWSAPEKAGGRATLGIEHGSGPKALDKLARFESPLPGGWLKVADHPRRGLVVSSPAGTDLGDALWWLLTATHIMSVVPLTGSWLARVYRP